jgi:hypothetical protein
MSRHGEPHLLRDVLDCLISVCLALNFPKYLLTHLDTLFNMEVPAYSFGIRARRHTRNSFGLFWCELSHINQPCLFSSLCGLYDPSLLSSTHSQPHIRRSEDSHNCVLDRIPVRESNMVLGSYLYYLKGFALRYFNVLFCPAFVLIPLSPSVSGREVGKIVLVFSLAILEVHNYSKLIMLSSWLFDRLYLHSISDAKPAISIWYFQARPAGKRRRARWPT